jgi:hypothetical protein
VAGVLLFTSACGSASDKYVTNKPAGVYVKLPDGWSQARVQEPLLIGLDARELSPEMYAVLRQIDWLTGIDASGNEKPDVFNPAAEQPNGFVQVRQLLPEEAKSISTNNLRDLVVPIDESQAAQDELVRKDPVSARLKPAFLLILEESVKKSNGVHGVHLVYQLSTSTGLVTFDQTSLLDSQQTVLYQLVMTCTALCYAQYGSSVSSVQRSFTVNPAT